MPQPRHKPPCSQASHGACTLHPPLPVTQVNVENIKYIIPELLGEVRCCCCCCSAAGGSRGSYSPRG